MTITKERKDNVLNISIEGRLDTVTAPSLEKELSDSLTDVTELGLCCEKLEYISSAGLRVLLSAQKIMNKQGAMYLTGVSDTVKEVLDITGFSDILTIR